MTQRQESKDSIIDSNREDAGNSDAARARRRAKDGTHEFAIRKDGAGFGLGKVEVAPESNGDADAAKARREARLTGK